MLNHLLTRGFRAPQESLVGVGFCNVKLWTNAMGEATSDSFVQRFTPATVVVIAGLVFMTGLIWQFSHPQYQTFSY